MKEFDEKVLRACQKGNIIELMDLSVKNKKHFKEILKDGEGFVEACKEGHLNTVRWWCHELKNQRNERWKDGIEAAVLKDRLEVVQYLMSQEVREEDIKRNFHGLWFMACFMGSHEVVKYWLEEDGLKFFGEKEKNMLKTGIENASRNNQFTLVKYLMERPLCVPEEDAEGGFMLACARGYVEVIKTMLCDPQLIEKNKHLINPGSSAGLCMAANARSLEVIEFLLASQDIMKIKEQRLSDPHADQEALFRYVAQGGVESREIMRWLLIEFQMEWTERMDEIMEDLAYDFDGAGPHGQGQCWVEEILEMKRVRNESKELLEMMNKDLGSKSVDKKVKIKKL